MKLKDLDATKINRIYSSVPPYQVAVQTELYILMEFACPKCGGNAGIFPSLQSPTRLIFDCGHCGASKNITAVRLSPKLN